MELKAKKKKILVIYYWIAAGLNSVVPITVSYYMVKDETGEARILVFAALYWAVLSFLFYAIYFSIPYYNKVWEQRVGILFPSAISLSCIFLIPEASVIVMVVCNALLSSLFLVHYNKRILTAA